MHSDANTKDKWAEMGKKKTAADLSVTGKKMVKGCDKKSIIGRRALFVEAYIQNGGNAAQAAITAGYSRNGAHVVGSRTANVPEVAAEIARRRAETLKAAEVVTGVSVERTLRELGRLAYADPRKLVNADGSLKQLHELDDDTAACIASFEVDELRADGASIGQTKKIKVWDKNSAIEKAMKYLGLYEKDNEQKSPTVLVVSAVDADL